MVTVVLQTLLLGVIGFGFSLFLVGILFIWLGVPVKHIPLFSLLVKKRKYVSGTGITCSFVGQSEEDLERDFEDIKRRKSYATLSSIHKRKVGHPHCAFIYSATCEYWE